MPVKRQCTTEMCPNYAVDGHSKCTEHKKEYVRANWSKIGRTHDFYNTPFWRMNRGPYLRNNSACVKCGSIRNLEIDHIKKHNGIWGVFIDVSNWQTLCKSCHNSKTGRGE